MERWDRVIRLRDDVNVVLETARNQKRIGKPLEASVSLRSRDADGKALLDEVKDIGLSDLFIVSRCLAEPDEEEPADSVTAVGSYYSGLEISVREAPGVKCPRCWMQSTDADPETGLCPRCREVLNSL